MVRILHELLFHGFNWGHDASSCPLLNLIAWQQFSLTFDL